MEYTTKLGYFEIYEAIFKNEGPKYLTWAGCMFGIFEQNLNESMNLNCWEKHSPMME